MHMILHYFVPLPTIAVRARMPLKRLKCQPTWELSTSQKPNQELPHNVSPCWFGIAQGFPWWANYSTLFEARIWLNCFLNFTMESHGGFLKIAASPKSSLVASWILPCSHGPTSGYPGLQLSHGDDHDDPGCPEVEESPAEGENQGGGAEPVKGRHWSDSAGRYLYQTYHRSLGHGEFPSKYGLRWFIYVIWFQKENPGTRS